MIKDQTINYIKNYKRYTIACNTNTKNYHNGIVYTG